MSALVGTLVGTFLGVVIGAALLVIGLWVARGARQTGEVLALHRLPPTPAARATAGARVKIHGTVVPTEHTVRSPITGRAGVVCIVTAGVDAGDGTAEHQLSKESCDFWLDDGSGARVLVRPDGAGAHLAREWLLDGLRAMHLVGVTDIGRVDDVQRRWAQQRLGGSAGLHYIEECLVQIGQPLIAVGSLEVDGATRWLRAAAPGGLTLLTMSVEAAREADAMRRTLGYGMAAMGAISVVSSVAWSVWRLVA